VTRAFGLAVFGVIAISAVAYETRNRRPSSDSPTLRQALDWLQARRLGQVAVFVAWAFTGWHFFVR